MPPAGLRMLRPVAVAASGGQPGAMYDVDAIGLLAREALRERAGVLIAETCAWSVGLCDRPHYVRRHGRVVRSGMSLGERAAAGLQLGSDEDGRLDLGDAGGGTFQDALNALTADGRLHADLFDEQVLTPFVFETCLEALEHARRGHSQAWVDLLDALGDEDADPGDVVRAGEWEAPLKTEAEQLVLAALGAAPLVEVEAEGLPLSVVRAAEAETRSASPQDPAPSTTQDPDLVGALFLADVALRAGGLTVPVPPRQAPVLLEALLAEGLEPEEVVRLLPHLPVRHDTAAEIPQHAGRGPRPEHSSRGLSQPTRQMCRTSLVSSTSSLVSPADRCGARIACGRTPTPCRKVMSPPR